MKLLLVSALDVFVVIMSAIVQGPHTLSLV
jgi:hypothetical protein